MPTKKKKNKYWNDEQELLVVEYINSEVCSIDRDRLANRLYPNIYRVSEEVIKRYFANTFAIDMEGECVEVTSYVFTKLELYNTSMNKRAFSYIQTVAKNYLLTKYRHNNNNKNVVYRNQVSIDKTVDVDDDVSANMIQALLYDMIDDSEPIDVEVIHENIVNHLQDIYDVQKTDRSREYIQVLLDFFNQENVNMNADALCNFILKHNSFLNVDPTAINSKYRKFNISLPIQSVANDDTIDYGTKGIEYYFDDYTPLDKSSNKKLGYFYKRTNRDH